MHETEENYVTKSFIIITYLQLMLWFFLSN